MVAGTAPQRGAAAIGVGYSVPETVVSNDLIAAQLGVDETWLSRRTGTRDRRVGRPGERLEHFAAWAAAGALHDAGMDAGAVDVVLVGTTSPDEMSPHAAPLVAADIGAIGAAAIDVSCACVGFLSAVAMGAAMIEAGRARVVVVVGADLLTRYLDPRDPQSAMLFGDGAGAVVLAATDGPWRVGPAHMSSDGSGRHLIRLPRQELVIGMDGPAVYRRAVQMMSDVTELVLKEGGLSVDDVDLFVYHQANSRIIKAVGDRLGLDGARVVDVVARFANTSSASLPIALGVAAEDGRLRAGDRLLLAAFGAGLVWGGMTLTWGQFNQHPGDVYPASTRCASVQEGVTGWGQRAKHGLGRQHR
jgi:3-oxoacyl-[acyl-carrier-protein] synthase-3